MTLRVLALLLLFALPAFAQAPAATFVYVVKPGKTPLKADPKLDAKSSGLVGYGQKLSLVKKDGGWVQVKVPGETVEGWISDKAVVDKRPGLDSVSVAESGVKVAASESVSTAGAIRGLDGRTAGYASAKQVPPEALAQLGRLESHSERIFRDPHGVDAKGVWRYKDATAPGRWDAAQAFAKDEGLHVARPAGGGPAKPAPVATPAVPQPTGTPAP